jgi:phospholipase/carboxylesterase
LPDTTAAERSSANQHTPIFLAHGTHDDVVVPARGLAARDQLEALGYNVQWHDYPMPHSVCPQEIADINAWLLQVLAPKAA